MIVQYVIAAYILLLMPIMQINAYKNYNEQIAKDTFNRRRFYFAAYIELWTPVIGLIALCIWGELSTSDLGLNRLAFNSFRLPLYIILPITALSAVPIILCAIYIYNYVNLKISEKFRDAYGVAISKNSEQSPPVVGAIMPQNRTDMILWVLISVSAGITEEIMFRGFLINILTENFGEKSTPLLLIGQAIPFALIHAYQGRNGMIMTFVMGLIFGGGVIAYGSIIPGIILHILIDLLPSIVEHEFKKTIASTVSTKEKIAEK